LLDSLFERLLLRVTPNIASPPDPPPPRRARLERDWRLLQPWETSCSVSAAQRFIPFAGTDDLSRSHFETRTASSSPTLASARNYRSGFLGRLSQTLGGTVPPQTHRLHGCIAARLRGCRHGAELSLKSIGNRRSMSVRRES